MIYKQVKRKYDIGYTKDGIFIKNDRIPPPVKEKLAQGIPEVEMPEVTKPCLFCDDQATHKRMVNLVTVDLCDYHYYSTNLGKVAEQLRKVKGVDDGVKAEVPKVSGKKSQPKTPQGQVSREDVQKWRAPSWGERIEIE